MYNPITIPASAKMLFNRIKLKEGVTIEDVEDSLGMMCYTVKENYSGFIAGQVLKYEGFVSNEGSINAIDEDDDHFVIITYWESFDEHERSHADEAFKTHFCELVDMADSAWERGYTCLWQGERNES